MSEIKQFKKINLIKEIVTLALYEQEQTMSGAPAPAPAVQGAAPAPNMGVSPAIPDPNAPDPNAPPVGTDGVELSLDSMIERLNVVRGGKSFTDPEIYGQLTSYFKTMTPEQKTVVDTFLQSISKIMIDVRTNTQADPNAPDPNAPPPPAGPPSANQAPIAPATTPVPAGAPATPPLA